MNRLDHLDAFVREKEDDLRRFARAVETANAQKVKYRIPGDLGTVRVGATGELLAIELDAVNLRYTTAAQLGKQLLKAVKAAEDKAEQAKREVMAAAERPRTKSVLTSDRRR